MTFTYDSTDVSTTLAKVRLEIGDTDSTAPLFTDEELNVYITARGENILLAAADVCDAAATKYARAYNFETDGQRFDRSKLSEAFRLRAADLRSRAHGVTTVDSTRIDGYSQDVANQANLDSDVNVRSRYYGRRDRLP